jgi:cytoskeletal protein RodZ
MDERPHESTGGDGGKPGGRKGNDDQETGPGWKDPRGAVLVIMAGLVAITAIGLAAVLVLALALDSGEATVAAGTSAFGVIGSIVGAYFGVKLGTEQATTATESTAQTAQAAATATKEHAQAMQATATAVKEQSTAMQQQATTAVAAALQVDRNDAKAAEAIQRTLTGKA